MSSPEYRFGISEFTTKPWSFARDLERYAAHHVDTIEVCQVKLESGNYEGQLRAIGPAGLGVSSVQTTVHSLFPDSLAAQPVDPKERLDTIFRSIDAIAPHVPAQTPFVIITGAAPGGNTERVYRHALDALARLADFAADRSMRIAFEPLNPILFNTDTSLWGLDRGLELVERIDHPALGLCCDTWNIFQTADVHSVIRACGKRIFLVQVSDWRRPHNNADRRCIGDGTIPTADLLATLRASGHEGPYVLEIFSSESLPDSLWTADLDAVIDRNIAGFASAWQQSTVAR